MSTYSILDIQEKPDLYKSHSKKIGKYVSKEKGNKPTVKLKLEKILENNKRYQGLKGEMAKIKDYTLFASHSYHKPVNYDDDLSLNDNLTQSDRKLLRRTYQAVVQDIKFFIQDAYDAKPEGSEDDAVNEYIKDLAKDYANAENLAHSEVFKKALKEQIIKLRKMQLKYPKYNDLAYMVTSYWGYICQHNFRDDKKSDFIIQLREDLKKAGIVEKNYLDDAVEGITSLYDYYTQKREALEGKAEFFFKNSSTMTDIAFWEKLEKNETMAGRPKDFIGNPGGLIRTWLVGAKEDVLDYVLKNYKLSDIVTSVVLDEKRTMLVRGVTIPIPKRTVELTPEILEEIRTKHWPRSFVQEVLNKQFESEMDSINFNDLNVRIELVVPDANATVKADLIREWQEKNKRRLVDILVDKYSNPKGGNDLSTLRNHVVKVQKTIVEKFKIRSLNFQKVLMEEWAERVEMGTSEKATWTDAIKVQFNQDVKEKDWYESAFKNGSKISGLFSNIGTSISGMIDIIKGGNKDPQENQFYTKGGWQGALNKIKSTLQVIGKFTGIVKLIRTCRVAYRSLGLWLETRKSLEVLKNDETEDHTDLIEHLKYVERKKRNQLIAYFVKILNACIGILATVLELTGVGAVVGGGLDLLKSSVNLSMSAYYTTKAIVKRVRGTKGKARSENAKYFVEEAWKGELHALKVVWKSGAYKACPSLYDTKYNLKTYVSDIVAGIDLKFDDFKERFEQAKQEGIITKPVFENPLFSKMYKRLFKKLASKPDLAWMEVLNSYS